MIQDTNLIIIIIISALAVSGGSLVAPILPAMIEPLNATEGNIGLILSIYTLFTAIFTPIFGGLADRIGRKNIIIFTTLLFGIGGSLIPFTTNFFIVLILRAFQGIGLAGMMSTTVTLIGDYFKGRKRVEAMGINHTAKSVVTATIPFISGALAVFVWYYPFFFYTLAIPIAIIGLMNLKEPDIKKRHSLKEYFKTIYSILRKRKVLGILLLNSFVFFLLYCMVVYFPIMLRSKFDLSTLYAGIGISAFSATSGIIALQIGKLMKNFSKRKLLLLSFVLFGLSFSLLPFVSTYLVLLFVLMIFGIGQGISFPILNVMITESASSEFRGGVVSGYTMMTYIGQTLSPPFFGLILMNYGLNMVFGLAGGAAFFVGLIIFLTSKNK